MRRSLFSLVIAMLISCFIMTGWGLFIWHNRETASVINGQGELIRLHVLANSDNPEDQSLKIKVRDAVIAYLSPYLSQVSTADEARNIIYVHKDKIIQVAQTVINDTGHSYFARVQLGLFDFPVKSYGSLVLPAGKYEAVRIMLGKAEGKNWWCVLFPPLCFIDAANATALPVTGGADLKNAGQPQKVEYKWKVIEIWNNANKN